MNQWNQLLPLKTKLNASTEKVNDRLNGKDSSNLQKRNLIYLPAMYGISINIADTK